MTKKLLALYGLKWNPFSPDVPTDALWLKPDVDQFGWRLEQHVRDGGFALITGDSGTGKSMAMRLVADRLAHLPDVVVGALLHPAGNLADLYRQLGELFDVSLRAHHRWTSFKALREKWHAHISSTLWRPVLLIDEAQEMRPEVLSELRLLSATNFDSRSILSVLLAGDGRLLEHFRAPQLLPLATRIRPRLTLDYALPKELADFLAHVLREAGAPKLMTAGLISTLSEHAAGNYRALCNMASELLIVAAQREIPQLDEKLFLELFAPPSKQRARNAAGDSRRTTS